MPDAAGLRRRARILELVQGLTRGRPGARLISGGGSALLPLPAPGLTLADKQAVNRALLRVRRHIGEMNCVRKHLSAHQGRPAGGGLRIRRGW